MTTTTTDELEFSAPASETSFAKESKSLPGLIKKIEELFDCRDGPYQGWVEHEGKRLPYVTLGIREHYRSPEAAEHLRNRLLWGLLLIRENLLERKFGKSLVASLGQDRRLPLYWRFAKEQRIQEETDIIHRKPQQTIRTRIAIPDADWSLIDFVTYTGDLYR